MASVFIFRRDYRLEDNIGLLEAMKNSEKVIPIFIFTPEQIKTNEYKSNNCVQFLCESLEDLRSQISSRGGKLYIFEGKYDYILQNILKNNEIENVYFNMDYTKYSHERDKKIEEICIKNKVECKILEDITLFPIGSIKTSNNKIYTKFTPYYNSAMRRDVPEPISNKYKNFGTLKNHPKIYNGSLKKFHDNHVNENLVERGGRQNGLKKLKKIGNWDDYDDKRNCISYTTTHLSAFNKFGCISIREVYHHVNSKIGKDSDIIRQLIWRDFFYNLSNYNPNIYKESLSPKFRNINWENNVSKFEKWKKGETGFPIVDACMKEINTTGYMHNRGRLIAGNFLVRLLFIDWRKGEKYFAQTLYDYDPTQNNFGWEINASVSGTESRPPSQNILNPWLQSKRFDPDGVYIKKWLPVLKNVKNKDLHQWDKKRDDYNVMYYPPIIDYEKERKKALIFYR
jgi:deoxyribodipyrimidine photo-lyase